MAACCQLLLALLLPLTGQVGGEEPQGNRHELRYLARAMTLAYSPDGRHLAVGYCDGTIWLWETSKGKRIRQIGQHPNDVWTVAFSPDGQTLVSGGRADLILRVWDVATGKELPPFLGHCGGIVRLIFSRDGQTLYLAGGSWDPTIRVWDVATRNELKALRGHTDYIDDMALSPDGTRLASASRDGSVRFWDLTTGRGLQFFVAQGGVNTCVAYSRDGRFIATGSSDNQVHLWETATRFQRASFAGHQESPQALLFARDGRTLISGAHDGTVRLWDIYTGKQRRLIRAHQGAVRRLVFAPDETTLASAGDDGVVRVWDLSSWLKERPFEPLTHRPEVLSEHFQALHSEDGVRSHQAVLALATSRRQSVPLLREHLKPVRTVEARQVQQLIAELDSPKFKTRDRAFEALAQLVESAAPELLKAYAESQSPEARRRLMHLLDRLDPVHDPERIRTLRGIEVLEMIGTAEAVQVLEGLGRGAPSALETREAQAALDRLRWRRPAAP